MAHTQAIATPTAELTDVPIVLIALVIAQLVLTVAAFVVAVLVWRRLGGYMRQCRATVQAYERLVERQRRLLEDTLPALPAARVHDQPTGRHALIEPRDVGMTDVAPAVGDLDDTDDGGLRVPPYYQLHESVEETVPRYYFAELAGGAL